MKFKHVLFSGLLMSTAFVACTNEEFQESGSQASMKDAISLGEGFTISGGIMNAQTRAIYEDETSGTSVAIKSLWEPNDLVGAAWYAAWTGPDAGFMFGSGNNQFASNHPYERVNKEGNVATAAFQTVTNSFAGKYVLYFPYNKDVAAVGTEIPVKSETAQTMDIAKPLEHVNKNMFFYQNKEYTTGGNQIADFELKPVPVLYRLFFKANDATRALVGKVISKVIIESNGDNLYSDGKLSVSGADYSRATSTYAGNTATNVYTLDVTGNETDTDYQVSAATTDGGMKKPIYISVLPANSEITTLTIKVITSDGAVFKKEITLSGAESVKTAITKEGGLFSSNITLDAVGEASEGVYTTQQFNKAWDEALKAGKQTSITLGAPMNLETLTMNNMGSKITIAGSELTVGTLNIEDGELTVNSSLKATDVNIEQYGKLTTAAATTIDGTLTIKGKEVTLGSVESLNNVLVDRQGVLSVTGAAVTKKIKGTFTSNVESEVSLKNIVLDGVTTLGGIVSTNTVEFNQATTLNNNAELTAAGTTTFKGEVTNNGTIANSSTFAINFEKKLTNAGTIAITGTNVEFKDATTNTGTVTVEAAATNSGTFTNRGVLTVNAALTNSGTLTLEQNSTGSADITNSGTVNVNAADGDIASTLNIVNSKTLNIALAAKEKAVTFTKLTNTGTVNIEKGTVKETAANAITQTAGEIKVAKDAKITFTATHTAFDGGYIIIEDTKANALENGNTQKAACIYTDAAAVTTIGADYVIFESKASLSSTDIEVVKAKSLVLRADLELQADMEMGENTSFIVEREVALTGKDLKSTLTFSSTGTTLEVKAGVLLTVRANAALTATAVNTANVGASYGSIVAVGGEYTPKS